MLLARLWYIDLLPITVYSHLNAIRMKSPASQLPSCVHPADRIKRFACQSAIRMSFRRILLPSLTRRITFNLANLVMRKTLSLKALEAEVLPLSWPGYAAKLSHRSSPWYRRFVCDLSRHVYLSVCDSIVSRLPPSPLPRVVSEVEPPVCIFGIADH
jgi:hypothetical protein